MENCKLALKCALTANVLSDYLGENSIKPYESHIEEVKKIIVQDEKFSNMTEIEKINTICDLINRVKTKNSLLSLLEKIPHVFDTYHYSDELPEIYYDNCDILNLLGIDFELCETDLGDKFTIISRFEVVGKNEQDRILNEFVKKKVR